MSSLAILAHGAHAKAPPPLNSLFYATVATVIPVLFLALAVQGTAYATLLKVSSDLPTHIKLGAAAVDFRSAASAAAKSVLSNVALAMAVVILLGGVSGEIQALNALYYGKLSGPPGVGLGATVILTLGVAAGPFWNLVRSLFLFGSSEAPKEAGEGPPAPGPGAS